MEMNKSHAFVFCSVGESTTNEARDEQNERRPERNRCGYARNGAMRWLGSDARTNIKLRLIRAPVPATAPVACLTGKPAIYPIQVIILRLVSRRRQEFVARNFHGTSPR
jgi:hypothetical protein